MNNNIFSSLIDQLEKLQDTITDINTMISDVDSHHDALKQDVNDTLDNELHEQISADIVSMTNDLNTHISQTEQLVSSVTDPERLEHIIKMINIQNEALSKQGDN